MSNLKYFSKALIFQFYHTLSLSLIHTHVRESQKNKCPQHPKFSTFLLCALLVEEAALVATLSTATTARIGVMPGACFPQIVWCAFHHINTWHFLMVTTWPMSDSCLSKTNTVQVKRFISQSSTEMCGLQTLHSAFASKSLMLHNHTCDESICSAVNTSFWFHFSVLHLRNVPETSTNKLRQNRRRAAQMAYFDIFALETC